MKIRVKFTKQGSTKFVGHLDTVRFFQRAIRAAKIPIAYSEGFNPHARVYFAMPLSVGMSSVGEYMDIVTKEDLDVEDVRMRLNQVLPPQIQISKAWVVEGKQDSLMSLVDRGLYRIRVKKTTVPAEFLTSVSQKVAQTELQIEKKTKKGLKQVDIRPLLFEVELDEQEEWYQLQIEVAAGSSQNLSPELFLKAVVGEDMLKEVEYEIERQELFKVKENDKTPIEKIVSE